MLATTSSFLISPLSSEESGVRSVTPATSCQGRCGNLIESTTCRCDKQCELFGDCCFDYNSYQQCRDQHISDDDDDVIMDPEAYSCYPLYDEDPSKGSTLLINTCSSNWTDTYIDDLCGSDSRKDFTQRAPWEWPVADQHGINFRNIFCAICNDRSFVTLSPWNIPFYSYLDGSQCQHELSNMNEVGNSLRYCFPRVISTCPDTFSNWSIVSLCKSYSNHASHKGTGEIYKNYHCAICNGLAERDIKPWVNAQSSQEFGTAFLRKLWSFTESKGKSVIVKSHCSERDTIYDPYTRQCVPVTCSSGFEVDQTGKCVSRSTGFGKIDGLCCEQQQAWISFGNDNYETSAESESCLKEQMKVNLNGQNITWQKRRYSGFMSHVLLQNNETCNIVGDLDTAFLETTDMFRLCRVDQVSYLYMCDTFASTTDCDGVWVHGEARDFLPTSGQYVTQIFQHKDEYIMSKLVLHQVTYTFDFLFSTFVKKEHVAVCGNYVTPPRPGCKIITLQAGDYHINLTAVGIRILHIGTLTLSEHEYIIYPNGRVQLCADILHVLPGTNHSLNLANIIGSGLSLIGLFLTCVLFCCYKDLRNLHGIFVMNLCVALFMAQLISLITSQLTVYPPALCTAMGVTAHLFWLSSFTWMSIISINLLRVFTVTRVQNREQRRHRSRYAIPGCGWGIPMVIVLTCVIVHMLIDSFPIYSEVSPCWMANPTSNLYVFGIPVGVSQVINVSLFVLIVIAACYKQRRSRTLQLREQTFAAFLKDSILCLKVS